MAKKRKEVPTSLISEEQTGVLPTNGGDKKRLRPELNNLAKGKAAAAVLSTVNPTRLSVRADATNKKGVVETVAPVFRNKEKVLVVCSRGITFRYRHLMEDMMKLLPHCKKDSKMENSKEKRAELLNEMADLKGCTSCLFFEARKRKDLYLWLSKTPNGPSAKFLVNAVHTMAELKLTGNHLKGSRPILTFSPSFDTSPHLQLLKELFIQIFGTPRDHRKVKPFHDHVLTLSVVDSHIWFRNYQVTFSTPGAVTKLDKTMMEKMTLVEVGPRFCLNPIKIFRGSFGGATLFENPYYISPNATRSSQKASKASRYATKVKAKQRRKQHLAANPDQVDELAGLWKE
eukprot:TRINITY_DN5057_c0_g1_i1.p1 TRINITY_DN5057_c0_g1~~TRINITY_DN5057_c0_g1_i1.p1  ORF type:complete len:344 (+),score=75.66 TRINITY_DN5057_c0_g1_i1:465-1496(+)